MPRDLDPIAKKEWSKLAPGFVKRGILTEDDGMAFSSLCTAYAACVRIRMALQECDFKMLTEKHSFLEQKSEEGRSNEVMAVELKINPLYAQQRLSLDSLRFWCSEFGTTPSSRGKINVPMGTESDPGEDYLSGR